MEKNGPDFLCIGAQASGSSWLYQQLREHPDFELPVKKEIHYFDSKESVSTGEGIRHRLGVVFKVSESLMDGPRLLLSLYRRWQRDKSTRALKKSGALRRTGKVRSERALKKKKLALESDSAYLSNFNTSRITGDVTPAYSILSDASVEHMAKLLPDAKIVFLIRNPIDRNWSAYRKKLKNETFIEYSYLEMKYFFSLRGVTNRTTYLDTIDRYISHFGKEKILIGFYDAIIEQPGGLLADIVDFLGGDSDTSLRETQVEKIVNESPKSDIPEDIERFLGDRYAPMIEELSSRYGSYASKWLADLKGIENRQVELKPSVRL